MAACNKDDDKQPVDNTRPVISEVKLNEKTEGIRVVAGGEAHLDIRVTDDRELGQMRIDIHNDFDGHAHGRLAASRPFEWDKIVDLKGKKEHSAHLHFDVPADAATGPYHLSVVLTDAAGNEAEIKALTFEITNDGKQPVITITSPDFSRETEVAPGGTLNLAGTVTDDTDLAEVHISISHAHHGHSHGRMKNEAPLFEKEYDLPGSNDVSFQINELITIPAAAEAGHYDIVIKAKDADGNYSVKRGELHVE